MTSPPRAEPVPSDAQPPKETSPEVESEDKLTGLGKRKRDGSDETRSASPTTEVEQPKRKRGRPRKVPLPLDGAETAPNVAVTGVVRVDLVEPATHPRPARQLFVFGNGDMGQFGLGTEVVSAFFLLSLVHGSWTFGADFV